MIEKQLKGRGILNAQVLNVFRKVRREDFLPKDLAGQAYEDRPLPIGFGQTISQPYIAALMTESLELSQEDRVLEVGTGSGYQTAILAELAKEVYSIELNESLHQDAKIRLSQLGYQNLHLKQGDGKLGWPEAVPFDKIIVTAGAEEIPDALIEQLQEHGKMIIPIGLFDNQSLILGRKEKGVLVMKQLTPVRFVPLQ